MSSEILTFKESRTDGSPSPKVTKNPGQVDETTAEFRQFDHGYAVTSHSSQGLTAGRVLAHIDTDSSRGLINDRLAYVAISRGSDDARIYTNNAETLGERLATDISKTAALRLPEQGVSTPGLESNRTALGNAAVPMPKLPEIDLEGFGLGL